MIKYQNISDSVVEIEVNLFKKLNTLQNNIISQLATHENMNDKNPNVSLQKNKNDQKYIDRMDTLTKSIFRNYLNTIRKIFIKIKKKF